VRAAVKCEGLAAKWHTNLAALPTFLTKGCPKLQDPKALQVEACEEGALVAKTCEGCSSEAERALQPVADCAELGCGAVEIGTDGQGA